MARASLSALAIVILLSGTTVGQEPDPRFRPRYSYTSFRLVRTVSTEVDEATSNDELLYRWQKAVTQFREVAQLAAVADFSAANSRLRAMSRQLPSPYGELAESLRKDPFESYFIPRNVQHARPRDYRYYLKLAQFCCSFGDRDLAVRLLNKGITAGPLENVDMLKLPGEYQSFELTEQELFKLERRFSHPAALAYCRRSLDQLRATGPDFALGDPAGAHSTFVAALAKLDEHHRRLCDATSAEERLLVYQATIAALEGPQLASEREAWQSKLLVDCQNAHEACAQVYFDRAIKSYNEGQREVALLTFQTICREHSASSVHGKSLFNVGLILQQRHQYNEALDAFQRILRKTDAEVAEADNVSSPVRRLRYQAAKAAAECYEGRNEPVRALSWLALLKSKYPFHDSCTASEAEETCRLALWKARLLAKSNQSTAAIALLEPMVLRGDLFAESGAELLVDLCHQAGRLSELETKLINSIAEQQKQGANHVPQSARLARRIIEVVHLEEGERIDDAWKILREFDATAFDIFSHHHQIELYEARLICRRAIKLLRSSPQQAGLLLIDKLNGSERDRGWAVVLLAHLKHPVSLQLIERLARPILDNPYDKRFSYDFRRDLACAIALFGTHEARQLMDEYGLGVSYYAFNADDLSSLTEQAHRQSLQQ